MILRVTNKNDCRGRAAVAHFDAVRVGALGGEALARQVVLSPLEAVTPGAYAPKRGNFGATQQLPAHKGRRREL